jgi:pimeloyl-ACP methyl ester carboxylesterase
MPLLDEGIAVMTIDWPGTGESASFTSPIADCDDMTDGIFELVAEHPELDPEQVVIGGFSLGGSVAVRCAVLDRRVLGAMTVTPPYDPLSWWSYVNPLVQLQLMTLVVDNHSAEEVMAEFGLVDLVPRLRSPLLVFGAGRDLVVPAEESIALAAAGGKLATLVWYPEGGHGLYGELDDWLALTGEWINGLVGREVQLDDRPVVQEPESSAVHIESPPERRVPSRPAQPAVDDALQSTRVDNRTFTAQPAQATLPRHDAGEADESEFDDDLWDD